MIRVPLTSIEKAHKVRTEGVVVFIPSGASEISVFVDGDDAVFFPERSSVHKRFLKSIGIDV